LKKARRNGGTKGSRDQGIKGSRERGFKRLVEEFFASDRFRVPKGMVELIR